jgi:hypothetical protein
VKSVYGGLLFPGGGVAGVLVGMCLIPGILDLRLTISFHTLSSSSSAIPNFLHRSVSNVCYESSTEQRDVLS